MQVCLWPAWQAWPCANVLTQWAVCAAWCDAFLPGPLQEALRQHLQQHAFSTATAPATLARLIQLAPPDMSTSTQAVITGWQSPGSPLLELTATPQVCGHKEHTHIVVLPV